MVYVTAIDTDSKDGNAAAYNGTLNVMNGYLFMDDMLVIITNPNLKWEQNPFVIYNRASNKKFKIGDVVTVGGSSDNYSMVNEENLKWKHLPDTNCKSKRIWLVTWFIDIFLSMPHVVKTCKQYDDKSFKKKKIKSKYNKIN